VFKTALECFASGLCALKRQYWCIYIYIYDQIGNAAADVDGNDNHNHDNNNTVSCDVPNSSSIS
jgi:hypothetical protein